MTEENPRIDKILDKCGYHHIGHIKNESRTVREISDYLESNSNIPRGVNPLIVIPSEVDPRGNREGELSVYILRDLVEQNRDHLGKYLSK